MRFNVNFCIEDGDCDTAELVIDGTDEVVAHIPVELDEDLQRQIACLPLTPQIIADWECDDVPEEIENYVYHVVGQFPDLVREEIERSFQNDFFVGLEWLTGIARDLREEDEWHPMAAAKEGEVPMRCRALLYEVAHSLHRRDREAGWHLEKILDQIPFSPELVGEEQADE